MNLADQFNADATAGMGAPAAAQAPTIAQQFMADAQAGSKAVTAQGASQQAQTAQNNGLAQDLSMGGSSPYGLTDLAQIGTGAAHGIGSLFNNAANFVERQAGRIGIFPQTAANDTAIQAASDQQFAQNASPGEKASAIVAPMLLPMSGAMAPGNALKAGITALPRMGGIAGGLMGAAAGNALNGGLLATGAPMDPNQAAGPQDLQHVLTGAGLGVALPAAFSAAKGLGNSVYSAARPIFNPQGYVGEQFAGQLGDQAAGIANNIRGAPTFVPDSLPTTAQVGQNPMLVATEKAQANANPDFKIALAQRGINNNDARWNMLMAVAQSPEALQAAQAARADAVQPLYDAAANQTANVGKAFVNLAQRPAMQQAMQQADQLAANRGETLVWPQQAGNKAISGRALDYTKQALDDMIGTAQANNQGSLAGGLQDARSQLVNWTARYIPAQREAARTFAQMSPPINTMQVGQQIANGLGTRAMNAGGAPEIGLMPFRSALTSAMGSGDAAEFGIDANALQQLQGIGQDLQRATVSNGLRSPGSDTAYNTTANGWLARNLYGPSFQGATGLGKGAAAAAALFTGHPWAAGGIFAGANKVGQMVGNRLNGQLNGLLLNPQSLLPYLDARAAGPVNASQQALTGLLGRNLIPAAIGGITRGGLMNSGN